MKKVSCEGFPYTPQSQCDKLSDKPTLFDFQSISQSCLVFLLNLRLTVVLTFTTHAHILQA